MRILSAAVVCSCCYCIVLIIDLVIAAAVVVVVVSVVAVVILLQFVLGGRNTHVDSSALSVHLPQKNQKFRTMQSPVLHISRRAPPKYWGLRSQSLEERFSHTLFVASLHAVLRAMRALVILGLACPTFNPRWPVLGVACPARP